jgi:transmembrane sensor
VSSASLDKQVIDGATDISAEAGEWLVAKFTAAAWSNEDQGKLDAWLAQSPAHRLTYWRLESAWKSAGRLSVLRQPMCRETVRTASRGAGWPPRIAAMLGLLVIAGASSAYFLRAPAERSYSTAIGEHKTLTLSDGSTIELTTNTAVRVALGRSRHVWLDHGEAFFRVVHDPARPFVIQSAGQRIIDLGTEFSVRHTGDAVNVSVLTGKVLVESASADLHYEPVTLTSGEMVVASAQSIRRVTTSEAEIKQALSWRNNLLVFDDTPLSEVAAQFNRYNKTQLVIADGRIANLKVGGSFPTTGVVSFVRVAQHILKLHVEQSGDRTVLTR